MKIKTTTYQNVQDTVQREKYIAVNFYIKKSNISNQQPNFTP